MSGIERPPLHNLNPRLRLCQIPSLEDGHGKQGSCLQKRSFLQFASFLSASAVSTDLETEPPALDDALFASNRAGLLHLHTPTPANAVAANDNPAPWKHVKLSPDREDVKVFQVSSSVISVCLGPRVDGAVYRADGTMAQMQLQQGGLRKSAWSIEASRPSFLSRNTYADANARATALLLAGTSLEPVQRTPSSQERRESTVRSRKYTGPSGYFEGTTTLVLNRRAETNSMKGAQHCSNSTEPIEKSGSTRKPLSRSASWTLFDLSHREQTLQTHEIGTGISRSQSDGLRHIHVTTQAAFDSARHEVDIQITVSEGSSTIQQVSGAHKYMYEEYQHRLWPRKHGVAQVSSSGWPACVDSDYSRSSGSWPVNFMPWAGQYDPAKNMFTMRLDIPESSCIASLCRGKVEVQLSCKLDAGETRLHTAPVVVPEEQAQPSIVGGGRNHSCDTQNSVKLKKEQWGHLVSQPFDQAAAASHLFLTPEVSQGRPGPRLSSV